MTDNEESQASVDNNDSKDNSSLDSDTSTPDTSNDVDTDKSENSNQESNEPIEDSGDSSSNKGMGFKDGLSNARTYNRAGGLNSLARNFDRGANRVGNASKRLGNASKKLENYSNKHQDTRRGSAANAVGKKMGAASEKLDGVSKKLSGANKKLQTANNINNIKNDPSVAKDMAVEVAKEAGKKKIKALAISAISAIGCLPFVVIFLVAICFLAVIGSVLIFDSDSNASEVATVSGTCSYNVNGKTVSNIKVRLLNCEGNTAVAGEELIDFETYITGVVYQETGDASYEALKTQAVAARSYALTRPAAMNGGYGVSLKEENGQWILSLRSCTNDQVFCNPDKGCWSNRKGGQTSNSNKADWPNCTVHSGYDTSKTWSRGPLATDSNIRKAVEETRGEVLVNSKGNIVNTDFTDTNQTMWNNLAKQGKDYFEILMADFGSRGASKIESNCEAGTSTAIDNADINKLINMSQSEAWYQLIGKNTNDSKPSVSESTMRNRVTTISVPIRTWKSGSGHNPKTDTTKKDVNITVNTALASLWRAFFTDVYNEATDFVIGSMDGCYVYRTVTGGGSLSAHAYGVACDINAGTTGNGYGQSSYSKSKWESLPETREKYQIVYKGSKVIEIAHKYTLINGSDWSNPNDAMHFSFIRDKDRAFAQACQGKITCPS